MTERNLQTEWARLLFASLADAGVRDVVISPGSRSTPFVVAAVREPRLARHDVIDERAAAFFALGQARITGRPSVVVCTSGTAPAHWLPAMIEANITGTPIILLSGDRPHELYDCRAPQTIDQVKLFGENARFFADLVPDGSEGALRALKRTAAQSVLASKWPRPGAVHLNARAKKPLEPVLATNEREADLARRAARIAGEPIVLAIPPRVAPSPDAIDAAASLVRGARRGIIVAGPASIAQRHARAAVFDLARSTGFALACEATSQLRYGPPRPADVAFLDASDLLLRSPTFRTSHAFDFAIQIGAPPTSGAWELVAASLPRIVLAEQDWPDPHSNARAIVYGEVGASCQALADAVRAAPPKPEGGFGERVVAANGRARKIADELLGAEGPLVEPAAVKMLVDRIPDASLLMVGNSLAVRLVDIYGAAVARDIDVLSQRGASGIDGNVAGACGAAIAAGRPLTLLIGDVSLLHDVGSLAVAARVKTPLVLFVLHNGGGRIFEQLPLVDTPGIEREIIEHATTPHAIELAPATALYGIRHALATTATEIAAALDTAYAHAGCTLIEVRVAPSGASAFGKRVATAVEAAFKDRAS